MRILCYLAIFILATNAYAWNKVGNGGDVLICNEGSPNESIQLLDVYEATELYGLPIQVNPQIKNDVELSLNLIERLKDISPARQQMLNKYAQNFYQEVKFVTWDLEDVPDHGFLKIPAGCKVKQLIVNSCNQDSDSFYNFVHGEANSINNENLSKWNQICRGRYKIDKRYWDKLDYIQKALSITHEAFMRDYRHMGDPEFSFDGPFHPVRYLNILLFSNKISQYNFKKFQQLYQSIGRVEQVREDPYGYIELNVNNDGPKKIKKIVNGQAFWETAKLITAVPQIELALVSYIFGMGEAIPVNLTKSEFYYFEDEINFSTNTEIEIPKNNYSHDRIKVTGEIKARRNSMLSHPFTIDYVFNYDTKGNELFRTGFSTPSYCHTYGDDSEIQPLDFLVTYTKYREVNDEKNQRLEYLTLKGLKINNSFLDIFIDSNEVISEIRPFHKPCQEEDGIADTIFVRAYGQVKIKNKWVKINNQRITIDLVKKTTDIWN